MTPTQLWATVFLNSLRLRRYDDAYEALIALPDRTQYVHVNDTITNAAFFFYRQSDFLAHLVTQVCDDHEERRLCQWPFHSLQNDLEKQLEFKANNDAVGLTVQPNYYKVSFKKKTKFFFYKKKFFLCVIRRYCTRGIHAGATTARLARQSTHMRPGW